jgi:hypothetical protein
LLRGVVFIFLDSICSLCLRLLEWGYLDRSLCVKPEFRV